METNPLKKLLSFDKNSHHLVLYNSILRAGKTSTFAKQTANVLFVFLMDVDDSPESFA